MDWFERLTGFREKRYEETQAKLKVDGRQIRSRANGKSYGIGEFRLARLETLRERAKSAGGTSGRLRVSVVMGDVRQMHQASEYSGALFQVASQFNALEMTGFEVTPEHGVTRYIHDRTQGPACAIAAGAATIYRNYFVPLTGGVGQTAQPQLSGLAPLGEALSEALGKPVAALANAQWLRPVQSGRARSDLGVSREPASQRIGCVAGKAMRRRPYRRRGDRRARRAPAAGLSGVLFCIAGCLHTSARSSLARIRIAGAGGRL
jgi:hypothetical protein